MSTLKLFLLFGACTLISLFVINDRSNKDSVPKMTKHEKVMARSAQEYVMTRDPNTGNVPTERLIKARQYKDILMEKLNDDKAKIPMLTWTGIGPNTVGGRTRAIMFDPTDATNKRVYAAGTSGGLWRNTDITVKSTMWTKVDDFMDNLTVVSLAYDPNNTSTWYAATGEIETSVTPGIGLFKSTDAGVTWTHLPSTSAYKLNSDVVVRNESGTSVIYLGSGQKNIGFKIGNPVVANGAFVGTSGLFRSADGGTTWTQVLGQNQQSHDQAISDLKIDASNNLIVAVGQNEFDDFGGDIYKCSGTNCNSAAAFTTILDASGKRTMFDVADSNTDIIIAISQSDAEDPGSDDIGFFKKTVDGGSNWTDLTIPKVYNINQNPCQEGTNHFTRAQAFYDLVLEIHPTDPTVVLLGGIDMYRSTDGGTNFGIISSWVRDNSGPCTYYMHADHHYAVFRPGFPNEVVFGNDGGVAYSPNAGDKTATPTFSDHVNGYITSQFYSCDISPVGGAKEYIGGLQDNGSNEWDAANGNLTVEVTGGDGAVAHIDQQNTNIQITATTNDSYNYTIDEWATPSQQVPGGTGVGRFINPSDYDDTNKILYAASGVNTIGRVTGLDGFSATLTPAIAIGGAGLGGRQASAVKVDPNTPTTIYLGTENGKVFKVENANGASLTSTEISPTVTQTPAETYVSSIDVQIGNSNHLLMTISNFGVKSIFESIDGGSTWVDIENNLPDMPIRWGVFNPANNDQALVATDMGVWTTDDINGASTSWEATNSGLANVRVDMIKYRVSDNTFVAGTHGRGLFIGNIGSGNPCQLANTTDVKQSDIAINATFHNGHITSGAINPNNVNVNANNVTFKGATDIILNPEFEVTGPNVLTILREDCPN